MAVVCTVRVRAFCGLAVLLEAVIKIWAATLEALLKFTNCKSSIVIRSLEIGAGAAFSSKITILFCKKIRVVVAGKVAVIKSMLVELTKAMLVASLIRLLILLSKKFSSLVIPLEAFC